MSESTPIVISEQPPAPSSPSKKKSRTKKSPLIGSKQQVWEGLAQCTGGKLTKDDLMVCPKSKKIISKKKHQSGLALMEKARKAREDPNHPLHDKFVSFFEHQYKKKPKDIQEQAVKKTRKSKVKSLSEIAPSEEASSVSVNA